MERLPDEILCLMMDQMDDETLLNSIKASDRFPIAFSNSSRLLSRFTLKATSQNINTMINDKRILEVSFKNVSMTEISNDNLKNFEELANSLKNSTETLELSLCKVESYNSLIGPLSQLKNLALNLCSVEKCAPMLPKMENLKSVTFKNCQNLFDMLKNQPELEILRIIYSGFYTGFLSQQFNDLANSLPKLKHLVMEGVGEAALIKNGNFEFRIEKLEAHSISFEWVNRQPRFEFFRSQKGSLKELTIHQLPYSLYGDQMLKYIIEEMQLQSFHLGTIPLILNGQKQEVKEFQAYEFNISAAFEMFRQFPNIDTFNLFLERSFLDNAKINRMLGPRTDLFKNVRQLNILENPLYRSDYLYLFCGLYKNCRNIKKLTIHSDFQRLDEVLKEVLPELTQLNEIVLLTNLPNAVSRFELIRNLAANVKKLSINANLVNEAREFFENDEIEIAGV